MIQNWTPLLLSLKLATITTAILLAIGVPLAFWISQTQSRIRSVIETLVSMPLVLPPSVLGFYLLVAFNQQSFLGRFFEEAFDLTLVFTFEGLVFGSVLFSLPFMVHPIQAGFESLPRSISEACYTLGKSKLETLFKGLLPNVKASLLSGVVLSFAHTIGEFGVVLMIGGNIPGETRVASIAIYDEVESLNYEAANEQATILFVLSFSILMVVYLANRTTTKAI